MPISPIHQIGRLAAAGEIGIGLAVSFGLDLRAVRNKG